MSDLKDMIRQAVEKLTQETGRKDVTHPELGLVVKDGKPTHALIAFFKKLQRKMEKAESKEQDSSEPLQ